MNKIYKVIWSKVKHQYVVVSELAHSNGKQSRTAKRSLRSRIAALVVCGAIAAFGVFGVTEQQAFAGIGQAVEAQYVAIAVDDSNDNGRNNRRFSFDRESYNYHKETLPGTNTTYWVRDGYSIKLEYGYRFPQSQGAADNKQIVAYKTDANADTGGLLQSNQVMIDTSSTSSGEPVTTYTGSILNDVEVGTYVGAVNTSSTETPATFNYYIEDDNGKYIDAGGNPDMGEENHFDERFVEATLNADGSYTVNIDGKNQVVSRDNLYVINDKYKDISGREHDNYKIGVFTTTSNQIYTGRVFGKHNEVLMTAQDKDGNYYSYWAANTDDPNAPLTGMTIGQFNTSLKEIDTNSRKLAGDDIKQIDVTSTGENKGTIGLLRRGTYNEATGEWEGNTYAPGTINITSEAKTGEDTKIRFANEANPDGFTVDAGSRVVGKTGADGTTEANPNDTLTGIEINGQNYKLGGGKIYTDGDGIAIDDENDNKISVRLKDDETNLTVDDTGLALNKDLTVDSVNAKGTTIDENGLTVGGTTYVSKEGLNAGGKAITNVANGVIDSDAVNLGQLKDVEEKADDAVEVAGKHTIVSTEDNNLTVENVAEEGQAANYEVALNKDLAVDSVTAGGTTISSTGLTAGKVNVDATTDTVSGLSNISWDSQKADEGYYKNSTKAATEAQLSAVNTTANKGWSLYITDKDGKQTLVKDVKPTNPLVSIDSGENVSITRNEDGNGLTISADLKDLDVEDTNAVLYDKDTNKTSVTLAGGESGTQIHNLADGTKDTDAVNLGQLTDKTGDLQYNTNHYVTNDEDLTISIGKLDNQVFTNTTNITELQNSTIDSGNVDEKGNINLTHTNADNTTTTIASIDGLKDYALKDGQYITKDKSGATLLTLQDQYDPNNTKTVKIDGLATYNIKTENGEVTGIDYGNIRLAGEIARDPETGEIIIDPKTGKEINTGTRITNLKAGYVGKESTDAVNGSQLYAVQQEAGKHTTVTVNGGVEAPEDGSYTNKDGHLDGNLLLKQTNNDGQIQYDIKLNPDVNLTGEGENSDNRVWLSGSNGTITVTTENNLSEKTTVINGGNVYVGSSISVGDKVEITDKDITGLSNTEWNGTTTTPDRAATEGQLQDVAIEAAKHTTVSGDKNITVKHEEDSQDYQVTLNDKVYLGGDHTEDSHNIVLDGDRGVIGLGSTIALDGRDGTAVIGGVNITTTSEEETGKAVSTITGLSNTTWEGTTETPDRAATEGQLQSVATEAAKHTTVSGDENITVKHEEGSQDYQVTLNPDVTLKGDNSSIELNGTKGTMQVNQETAEGTNFTNINGNVVSIGYTNSEGIENAIVIDGGKGTITGLSNTTWDDELAKQVANSEELQGTAATQGQLQQAVNEVAEVANAGWNAKAGGNTINVKPNETLNFEGDGNITVSATSGTSSELKFGLNHNITLDNVKDKNTMLVINTDGREGYIPDNYKDSNEDAEDFIGKHGGFAIYYANPSLTTGDMTGTFGVTTDGVVHAKDVISYYSASSGSQSDVIRYSLNDVGDIVTQISHAVFDEGVGKTGMEYTLISDFEDEADKDSPFDAKEGKTRTIGLAVRQDGAVIVGAVVNDEGISRDRGIRINAETKTTYDKNGNEVTNNIATITGLENTEWKPPTPVATLAANDGSATVTSRAATESQLNDLYSAVAAYDVNVDGTIDYSHIALAGTPYGASRSGNGTPTGGTSITNVAYASGKDGSEAVNVDYLNDAINNAVKDGGAISDSDRHLQEGTYHVNDQGKVELIVADEKGENQSTVTIDNIANKNDITNLDNKIDNTFNDLNDKINNIDNVETDVKGGNINEDGTISLKTENEDGTTTNVTLKGQLTDSGVVQEGTTFDKETGTLTITSQDKYSGETSSVTVEGIASTEVVGATTKEDLATAYKDADKDGNATTEYITDSESMVEADVALDHAIQDVAGTSYANDMVLSNRIDSVEKRLGNVEERIDKVGAMAAAIANLRTMGFDPEAPTEIAIGVGQYKSETGIAIGVFHYPNQDFMLSASLSSSGDELMGGIGATWKLGRKSAAERAKDEEARHLEQAEEMKKLAQQEKVKAQAQRHAKLLAERQQASQKNA